MPGGGGGRAWAAPGSPVPPPRSIVTCSRNATRRQLMQWLEGQARSAESRSGRTSACRLRHSCRNMVTSFWSPRMISGVGHQRAVRHLTPLTMQRHRLSPDDGQQNSPASRWSCSCRLWFARCRRTASQCTAHIIQVMDGHRQSRTAICSCRPRRCAFCWPKRSSWSITSDTATVRVICAPQVHTLARHARLRRQQRCTWPSSRVILTCVGEYTAPSSLSPPDGGGVLGLDVGGVVVDRAAAGDSAWSATRQSWQRCK